MEIQYSEWPTNPIWINYRLFRINLLRPSVLVINMTAPILCIPIYIYPYTHIILKISDIIKLQIASFVFESRMRLSPLEIHTYFTRISDAHSYGTRQSTSDSLFQPRRRTTQYGLNMVHYFGATLWNSVDDDIKKSHSLNAFRRKLKLFYLGSYA